MSQPLPPNAQGAQQPPAPVDMNQQIDDLIFICERLNTLLLKENAALDAKNMDAVDELLEEKELLCRAYESRGRPLIDHGKELAEADPNLRNRLRDLVYEVEVNMRINTRRLSVEVAASRHFFDTLADAVRENTPKSGVYGGNGRVSGEVVTAPKGVPLSIDQSL